MLKRLIKFVSLISVLFVISACGEPKPAMSDLNLPFAKYEPDPSQESNEIGVSIEFYNETDNLMDTYGHLKVAFPSSILNEHSLTRDDRIPFEIKGTNITGEVSERIRENLTDLSQGMIQIIQNEEPLTLVLHLSEDQIAEIDLIYRTPSIPSL